MEIGDLKVGYLRLALEFIRIRDVQTIGAYKIQIPFISSQFQNRIGIEPVLLGEGFKTIAFRVVSSYTPMAADPHEIILVKRYIRNNEATKAFFKTIA